MVVPRPCSLIAATVLSLLFASSPVAAVPHHHKLAHRHPISPAHKLITLDPESLAQRSTPVKLGDQERMSEADVSKMRASCNSGDWPLAPGVPMPIVETEVAQLNLFRRPESTTPNALTMYNYCPYDLYFVHYTDYGNVLEDGGGTLLAPGQSASRTLAGSAMKVYKTKSLEWPFQIEYSDTFYDMSLINCLGTTDGKPLSNEEGRHVTITTDTSRCAGHEAGLHLSQPEGPTFQCEPGLWCDGQAFMYEEQLCKEPHPNLQYDKSKGISMEFCAGKKP